MAQRGGRGVVEVPHKAVRSGVGAEVLGRPNPPGRNVQPRVGAWSRVGTREPADPLAGTIKDLEDDRPRSRPRQVVVDDRAVGGILRARLIGRKRRVGVCIPAHPHRARGPEEIRPVGRGGRGGGRHLAQRSDVVEDPEAAPVRADDQVAVMQGEVAHSGRRQVESQALPVVAVVERHVHAVFGAREQESPARRVLPHRVHHLVHRNALDRFLPRAATVARAVDVRPQVVEPEPVHGRVRGERVEVRGFEHRHLAPRRERGRRDVAPRPPAVVRHVDQAVVAADPDQARLAGGRRETIDHAAVFPLFWIERREHAQCRGHLGARPRQIGTDRLPAQPTVRRLEQDIGTEVQRARVAWREHQRHRPHPAVLPRPHGLG